MPTRVRDTEGSDVSLGEFEGDDVREVAVKITKAGDGLSDALKVEPRNLHHGDEVFYVLRGQVQKITHEPVKAGSDDLRRVHTITTLDIAEVAKDDVTPMLERAAVRVRAGLDKIRGVEQLNDGESIVPFDNMTPAQQKLYIDHGKGSHAAAKHVECPLCDAPPVRDDLGVKRATRAKKADK